MENTRSNRGNGLDLLALKNLATRASRTPRRKTVSAKAIGLRAVGVQLEDRPVDLVKGPTTEGSSFPRAICEPFVVVKLDSDCLKNKWICPSSGWETELVGEDDEAIRLRVGTVDRK